MLPCCHAHGGRSRGPRQVPDGEALVRQGEEGQHFYLLDAGECVATITNGACVQEVKRYQPGDLFGEKALLESTVRAATITAVGEGVRVWALSREAFEAKLGCLSQLKAEQYITDPRTLIATFYGKGDGAGSAGTLGARSGVGAGAAADAAPASDAPSSWFAVYRPCSRDSIAKMLGRVGTGKGLNIKGKSAKKNRLSGFVPFCQISRNEDKAELEATPADARFRIFYHDEAACATARAAFESMLVELQVEKGSKLQIAVQEVRRLTEYEPAAYGLDVPEAVLMQVYIHRADVSPEIGWETGRDSEPAFLDMNRHALRDGSAPPVVLYQFDKQSPLNPLGLLMAYAEARVTPVVSDFDTFLVGSKGMRYDAPPPPEQVALMHWALGHTKALLAEPNMTGWMGRWLKILKEEARNGFHPALPKYGFGDPTSYGLIGDIVDATSVCGAVRHGAECFNFYFPQELDPEFLIVWDGLDSPPWKSPPLPAEPTPPPTHPRPPAWPRAEDCPSICSPCEAAVTEPELRAFLLERAAEGFSFPLNPVWPVRDQGWLEVLHALQSHGDEQRRNLQSWFPPASGLLESIEAIHAEHPEGFCMREDTSMRRGYSVLINYTDCDTRDLANFASLELSREAKARWRRVLVGLKMYLLNHPAPAIGTGARA